MQEQRHRIPGVPMAVLKHRCLYTREPVFRDAQAENTNDEPRIVDPGGISMAISILLWIWYLIDPTDYSKIRRNQWWDYYQKRRSQCESPKRVSLCWFFGNA